MIDRSLEIAFIICDTSVCVCTCIGMCIYAVRMRVPVCRSAIEPDDCCTTEEYDHELLTGPLATALGVCL